VAVRYGREAEGMKLIRRTSTGSSPAERAKASMARSMAKAASGRPAPRYEPVGAVLVTTEVVVSEALGMS
jgi:hypothetical protein